jgi:hypothetical protein
MKQLAVDLRRWDLDPASASWRRSAGDRDHTPQPGRAGQLGPQRTSRAADTAPLAAGDQASTPGPTRRNFGQGTRWHQPATVALNVNLIADLTGSSTPGARPLTCFHSSMSAGWSGLSSGSAVVDVEGPPARLGLRDRPQGNHGSPIRERPTAAGAPADRSSPSAACPGEYGTALAPEPTAGTAFASAPESAA